MKSTNLAYASSIWMIRALWNLAHTKRRYDLDDVSPMNKEEWLNSISEAKLSVLRLNALMDKDHPDQTLDIFLNIEHIFSDIQRLRKELLYFEKDPSELLDPIQKLDFIYKSWIELIELETKVEAASYFQKVDKALDLWLTWLHRQSTLID